MRSKLRGDGCAVDGPLRRHDISHEDHPLSLGETSVWHQYFRVSLFPKLFILSTVFITQELKGNIRFYKNIIQYQYSLKNISPTIELNITLICFHSSM